MPVLGEHAPVGAVLLVSVAELFVTRSQQQRALPRAWGWLSVASAIGCWLVVLLTLVIVITDVPAVALAGKLVTAVVGVVLIPVWLTWLGRQLHVGMKREQIASADGVSERKAARNVRVAHVAVRAPGWLLRVTGRPRLALEQYSLGRAPDRCRPRSGGDAGPSRPTAPPRCGGPSPRRHRRAAR